MDFSSRSLFSPIIQFYLGYHTLAQEMNAFRQKNYYDVYGAHKENQIFQSVFLIRLSSQ